MSRIAADLGDRVHAGDALVELDKEKLQHNLDQQKAALTRTLAQLWRRRSGTSPARSNGRPMSRRRPPSSTRRSQAFDRAGELNKRAARPEAGARGCRYRRCARSVAALTNRLRRTREPGAPTSTPSQRDECSSPIASCATAVIRAPFDGYVQKRLMSLGEVRRRARRR